MSYYAGIVLADSPIRYYPLSDAVGSGVIVDMSGNAQNGTPHGGVTLGQSTLTASTGTAALFDGSSGYISLPTTGLPTGAQPWTVEAWASLASPLESGRGSLIGFGTYASQEMALTQFYASGPNQWVLTCYGFDIGGPTSAVNASTTYHVVGTYDGSHTRIYVNGVLVATSGSSTSLNVTNVFAQIGAGNTGGSSDRFKGTLQHAAIYNYALTASQIGAHYSAGATGPQQYYAQVAGKAVSLVNGSMNVQNQIGQRSTGSLSAWSSLGTVWQYGTAIQIYDETSSLVYSGFVVKDKVTKSGARLGTGYLEHQLTCSDNCYRADKRVIFYSNLNVSAGSIARDLVNKVLYQEGVTYTATSISDGPTVPEVIWNGKQVSACLDFLAKTAGYYWNIDTNNVLNFLPYGGTPAPFVLDGTQVDAGTIGGLSVEYGNDLYVNTQYTLGGNGEKGTKTNPIHETLWGDGKKTSFTLQYPVSTLYQLLVDGVDVTTQALTKGSGGGQYYYAAGDAVIAQDSSYSVLGSGDYLDVYYSGRVPAIGKAKNASLITAQQTREGTGSGIVESAYKDTKVHTLQGALQIASALLAHYGADTTVLEFDTRTKGLVEGQWLTVNLSDFGLVNKGMLINSVTITDQVDGFNIWFHVQAVGSPVDAAQFQTFWQNLMNQQSDPSDLSDVSDAVLTPIETSTFSHSPLLSIGGFKTVCPICGPATLAGSGTIVC